MTSSEIEFGLDTPVSWFAHDSFPLFGFDLADYETLFEEKLDLLLAARSTG